MITIIICVTIVVCILVSFISYKSDAHFLAKLFVFPLIIFISGYMVWQSINYRGQPVEGYPAGEFTYIHHINLNSESIIIWVKTKGVYKLFEIGYDRETVKKLKEQQESQGNKEGKFIKGEDNIARPSFNEIEDDPQGNTNEQQTKKIYEQGYENRRNGQGF